MNNRRSAFFSVLLFLAVCFPMLAHGHQASSSLLYWHSEAPDSLRLDIALRDVAAYLLPDKPEELYWRDLLEVETEMAEALINGIRISSGKHSCASDASLAGLADYRDTRYAVWTVSWRCPASSSETRVDYRLFFQQDALHRALVTQDIDGAKQLSVLSPSNSGLVLGEPGTVVDVLKRFLVQGMIHMWLGLDHVLFLLSLIMLVFARAGPTTARGPLKNLLIVATSFTVAHSITLVLSSLKLVSLPVAVVESLIALSISVSALKVLFPRMRLNTLVISFGFGLLHGLGFAEVLSDLIANTEGKIPALFAFNVGVEVAQVAIVLLLYPLFVWLNRWPLYRQRLFAALSVIIVVMGLVWVAQRSGFTAWLAAL